MSKKRILMLASNPRGTDDAKLLTEYNRVRARLGRTSPRYDLQYCPEVGATGLADELYEEPRPWLVHIGGHGDKSGRLLFTADDGGKQPADQQAVADVFEFSDGVECVVLSACYSARQARLIARHVKYVVGMAYEINVESAITFAEGFYGVLGRGYEEVERAFRAGVNRVGLSSLAGGHVPRLWVDGRIYDYPPIPNIEDAPEEALTILLERRPALFEAMAKKAGGGEFGEPDELVEDMLSVHDDGSDETRGEGLARLGDRFVAAMKFARRSNDAELARKIFRLFNCMVSLFARCYPDFAADAEGKFEWEGGVHDVAADPRMAAVTGRSSSEMIVSPSSGAGDGRASRVTVRARYALDPELESGIDRREVAVSVGKDMLTRSKPLERIRVQVNAEESDDLDDQIQLINAELRAEMGAHDKSHYFSVTLDPETARALAKIDRLWVILSCGKPCQHVADFKVQVRRIYTMHAEIIHESK